MIKKNSKIYISGHNGLVGSSCLKVLKEEGYNNIIGKSSKELDLTCHKRCNAFFKNEKPEVVINAAAKVGGILANKENQYEFLIKNLKIQNNIIECALKYDVKKFIFLGSSCVYPKKSKLPIKETELLKGDLEQTNRSYALAKITGIELCKNIRDKYDKDFISLMPCNLYGPNDNYDLTNSHVIPALISKFQFAKIKGKQSVEIWGSGKPLREFMYAEDLAKAILKTLNFKLKNSLYNVGTGKEISISDLAHLIKKIVGFKGEVVFNLKKPDGTFRKVMNSSKFIKETGWNSETKLKDGISKTYKRFIKLKLIN